MNLSISPGKNNVGAYINDINLKSLDQDQATEIKKILNKYGVVFLKEQNLDVLLDDVEENMSNKFKKHDLIGIPFQIIIGSKSDGQVPPRPDFLNL